jgi:hypothetical protein
MKLPVRRGWAVVLLAVTLSLVGCARSQETSTDVDPVRLQAVTGTNLHRVILTERAAENLGILTENVHEAASGTTTRTIVALTAVVYDPEGTPWVYTTPSALTFVRARIVIDRTTVSSAYLTSGPPVGTAVVTVGASELLGTEYGVGGE